MYKRQNLHIHCGGITAVIGRNGAGKSTLLKAILKEIPSTGTVEFSGHDGRSIPRLRIGYVPQSLAPVSYTHLLPLVLPHSRDHQSTSPIWERGVAEDTASGSS